MTRIEVDNGWFITDVRVEDIIEQYLGDSLIHFIDTADREVYIVPGKVIAIVKEVVPAEENNSD